MANFRTRSEMGTENDFIQALERLVSGDANVDSSLSGTYETGINRPLGRLSRNADALLDAIQTAKNCILTPASASTVIELDSSNNLTLSGGPLTIRMSNNVDSSELNTLANGTLGATLSAGDVVYVVLDRTGTTPTTPPTKATWSTFRSTQAASASRLDFLVLGVMTNASSFTFFNGLTVRTGERLENGLATDTQYASRFNVQQNANRFITGGGNLTFDATANTLGFSADLVIQMPDGGQSTITTATPTINNLDALHCDLSRTSSSNPSFTNTPLSGLNIINTTRDLFIFAYRSGNVVYLANGASIQDGETYRLESSPVYALTVDDGAGSDINLDGTLEIRAAAGQVIEGSTADSRIRVRNRRDNLQVSIGTTLSWDSSTGDLTFGSTTAADGIRVQHPDYSSGSAELSNFIAPAAGTLTLADGDCAYVALAAVTVSSLDHDSVTAGAGSTPGIIYIDEIEDVDENDADIFIFAYRVGTKLYLWDGTFLEGAGGGSTKTVPGTNHDRLILSQQYRYYHEDIVFKFDQSGSDKVEVSWGSEITLYWPSGGQSTINADTIDLTAALPVIRVTIPESDRASSGSASFSATAVAKSAVNSADDIILFELTAVASSSVADALTQPVKVFGGRKVHQNYEVSGGATAGTTGHVNIGRDSTLTMLGQKSISEGLWYGSYPSSSNPFVTASHDGTFRIGEYSGAEYEGGSATFSPKFTVTGSSGAVVSRGSVQGTDFTFGTTGGSPRLKRRKVFLSALDIFRQLDTNIEAKLYTSDSSGSSPALPSVVRLNFDNTGALATGHTIGPSMHGLQMSDEDVLRFPHVIPSGCTLDTITLFWALTGATTSCHRRVSNSKHISNVLAFTGTYSQTDRSTLLTDGTATTVVDSETFVDATSTVTTGLVKRAVFDFGNAAVSNSGTSKQITDPLQRLYIGVVQASGGNQHLLGISIEYTASSVEALFGIEDA